MSKIKEQLHRLRESARPAGTESCPQCGKTIKGGWCFYCGAGERPTKTKEQRERDEMRAINLWNQSVPITGTLAERYLRRHRKIEALPPNTDDVLRFHPKCPFDYQVRVPAMVALLRDVNTDHRPCGIHRTPLDPETAAKTQQAKTYGTFYRTAIKLWPSPVGGRLTIGEGIETVLSAVELWPHLAPAWAVGTANNLGMFPFLDDVNDLHILANNDPAESGKIGQAKAKQCSGRYSAWAKRSETHTPRRHKDFNDMLRELRRE